MPNFTVLASAGGLTEAVGEICRDGGALPV